MSSPIGEKVGSKTESLRDCLLQLNALVPKSLGDCSKLDEAEKAARSEKIAHILFQVFDNQSNFSVEQRTNLMNIRDLAKKAEKMHLLSKPAKKILSKIADDIKKIGLSLYTSPLDYTIQSKNGDVRVNSDILKKNSPVFKKMLTTGLKEQREEIIALKNYSKESVELMMRCLHAPSDSSIVLPSNSAWTLELLDLAMAYGLDDLVKKLELPVSKFISDQSHTILDNAQQWLTYLTKQKAAYPETTSKLLAEMTPIFLKYFDIPVKQSEISGKFEIPIEHINTFFKEETRDLMQYLPVILDVKGPRALMLFEDTCKKFKPEESLSIKLYAGRLTEKGEFQTIKLAKRLNIEVSFEKPQLPPGTTLFGKEQWETYFGPVGEVPPIPAHLIEKLTTPSYIQGKTFKETHMLVLIPATVNNKPLNLNHLLNLVQAPKGGGRSQKINSDLIDVDILRNNKAPVRSRWILMSKDVIPDSRSKTYQQQQALVEAILGCEVPDVLSASVAILTHHTHTGVRLFAAGKDNKGWTFTRCKEIVRYHQDSYQAVVGGFSESGIRISDYVNYTDGNHVGVAPLM